MNNHYEIKNTLWLRVPTSEDVKEAESIMKEFEQKKEPHNPFFTTIDIRVDEDDKRCSYCGIWEYSVCYELIERYGADNVRMKDVDVLFEIEKVRKNAEKIDNLFGRYSKVMESSNAIKSVLNCGGSSSMNIIKGNALVSISNSLHRIANVLERTYPQDRSFGNVKIERGFINNEKGEENV